MVYFSPMILVRRGIYQIVWINGRCCKCYRNMSQYYATINICECQRASIRHKTGSIGSRDKLVLFFSLHASTQDQCCFALQFSIWPFQLVAMLSMVQSSPMSQVRFFWGGKRWTCVYFSDSTIEPLSWRWGLVPDLPVPALVEKRSGAIWWQWCDIKMKKKWLKKFKYQDMPWSFNHVESQL